MASIEYTLPAASPLSLHHLPYGISVRIQFLIKYCTPECMTGPLPDSCKCFCLPPLPLSCVWNKPPRLLVRMLGRWEYRKLRGVSRPLRAHSTRMRCVWRKWQFFHYAAKRCHYWATISSVSDIRGIPLGYTLPLPAYCLIYMKYEMLTRRRQEMRDETTAEGTLALPPLLQAFLGTLSN